MLLNYYLILRRTERKKAKKTFNDIIKKAVDESSKEANKALGEYESLITKHNILPDDTVITGDHSKVNSYIQFNINKEHPKDKPIDRHSFDEVYAKGLEVMDMTAFTLCKENKLPIIVFDMNKKHNLKKLMDGEKVGTLVNM